MNDEQKKEFLAPILENGSNVFFALAKKLNEREDFSLNETDKNVR